MKKAIIIGASTGIGREVAIQLAQMGYEIGLVARRKELLLQLQTEIPGKSHIMPMDISDTVSAREKLASLIEMMGNVDMIILNAGIGIPNPTWQDEQKIIQTNVNGFVALANYSFEYFQHLGRGCIVGVSSIAGLRGARIGTAYCASKAFISNYMEGLQCRVAKEGLNITITDVIPGFVETPMTANLSYKFWVASAKKVATQMIVAILEKKERVFVTKRWAIVAALMKVMPLWLLSKI
jgi:short-subunit dehydrogenase